MVYSVSNVANKYTNKNYTYKNRSSMTIADFETYIRSDMKVNHPVILHADASKLSYYSGSGVGGHYITVIGIDCYNKTVTVNDCNWNVSYRGRRTISLQEAYNCIEGRYLIY